MSVVDPLRTSHGAHRGRIASLVQVVTTDGIVGWGEDVCPDGVSYVGGTPQESFESLRMLSDLIGRRSIDVYELFAETWWGVSGHNFAKHALESALWDAHARTKGISLKHALGGVEEMVIPGVVIGVHDSLDQLEQSVRQRLSDGYQRIKLKIHPGWDVEPVRRTRELVGDDFALQVDANASYVLNESDALIQLQEFNIQSIEQPFVADNLAAHAEFARRTTTAICLDESIMNVGDLMLAIEQQACSVVNIKPSRLGGIADAVQLQEIAKSRGVATWVGGMLETGVGRASCLALASRPGFTLTPDLSASNRYFEHDVTDPFILENGAIRVPDTIGIGVAPLPWVFEHPEVRIETLFTA